MDDLILSSASTASRLWTKFKNFEVLAKDMDTAVLLFDTARTPVYFNQAARRLLGLGDRPIQHFSWNRHFKITRSANRSHPYPLNDPLEIALSGCTVDNTVVQMDTELDAKRGNSIRLTAHPILEDTNQILGAVVLAQDLSDKIKIERTQKRFQLALNMVPLGIVALEPDSSFRYVNPWLCQALGYTKDEFAQIGFSSISHPLDKDKILNAIESAKSGDLSLEKTGIKSRYTARDGRLIWARTRFLAVRDGEKLDYILIMFEDLTEQERTKALVRKTMNTVEGLYKTSPLAIIELDDQGTVLSWSEAATQMFGWTEKEAIGRFLPIVGEHQKKDSVQIRQQLTEGRFSAGLELVRYRKDGSEININVFAFPVENSHPGRPGITAFVSDISIRKQEEEALLKAKNDAEQANRSKTHFLANMSHEIRTPLTAILGYSELLSRTPKSSKTDQQWIDNITRNGKFLLELLQDIIDLSKIEAGALEIDCDHFSPVEVIDKVIATLYEQAVNKGIQMELQYLTEIPKTIYSYSTGLRQILNNVIGNAIKFTQKGTIRITVQLEGGGEKIRINVADSGVGVQPEQRKNLFKAFSQGDSSTAREFGGSGLGLRLSREIARVLGGDLILLRSEPNEGSEFSITFSTELAEEKDYTCDDSEGDLPDPDLKLNGLKILMVDDCLDNQIIFKTLMENAGAQVDVSPDGLDGVKRAMDGNYDLVLMDIQMPRLDGHQATQRLRKAGFSKPIIALTAHAMLEDRRKSIESGCDEYLSKPIEVDQLIASIAKHCSKT